MSNDPLKDLFNETFANEPIAFDPTGWDQMEKMLNRERRKKAFWIWLSSGSGLVIMSLVCLLLMQDAQALYQPRQSDLTAFQITQSEPIEDEVDHPKKITSIEVGNPEPNNPKSPVSESTPAQQPLDVEQPKAASPSKLSKATHKPSQDQQKPQQALTASNANVDSPKKVEQALAVNVDLVTEEDDAETKSEFSSPLERSTEESELAQPIAQGSSRQTDELELLPMLGLHDDDQTTELEGRSLDKPMKISPPMTPYIRLGISSHFSATGFGQIGGIGLTKQLGEKVLFSAELLMARDQTRFHYSQNQVSYGFDQNYRTLSVETNEMIHLELPLLLRYRINRLTLGAGISTGILWASEVAEVIYDSQNQLPNAASQTGESTRVGYVNWSSLRQLQFSLPIDIQYQLDQRYFVGARFNYGLTDAFVITPDRDRLTRYEIYLKMNLQR